MIEVSISNQKLLLLISLKGQVHFEVTIAKNVKAKFLVQTEKLNRILVHCASYHRFHEL